LKYKDQYLAYLNKKKDEFKELWSEHKAAQMDVEKDETQVENHSGKKRPSDEQELAAKKKKTDDTPKQLDYTPGIIVRVSKLHLDSPKTVVVKLLEKSGSKIAFMKPKRKGIDSTFIRLETPQDAIKLHGYFESHHVVQKHGKDETGDELDASSHETVSTKIIEGKGFAGNRLLD
jgi:hypothetical protein